MVLFFTTGKPYPINATMGRSCRTGSRSRFPQGSGGGKSGLHRAACRLTAGGDSLQGEFYGKCHRKYTAAGRGLPRSAVRVKRCGKSAPRAERFVRQGKPHAEQDQIGEEERPAPFDSRVGC